MKLELGYGTETYGTVETSDKGLVYAGKKPDVVQRLIESMRQDESQNNETFLASLPTRLTGRVWARTIKEN